MNVNNISNGSVVFKLSGKDYQVKRLNLMDLFGQFEADIKKTHMDDIVSLATRITDSKERIEFQRQAIRDLPKGKELEEAVKEAMDSFDGGIKLLWMSLSKCNKVTIDEVRDLILDEENEASITNIMNFITGQDATEEPKEEEKLPEGAIKIESEKKTETPTLVTK